MSAGLPALPLAAPEWVFLVLMTTVLLAPFGARRVRLPGILGLIVAGTVIGPNVLGLVERDGLVAMLGGAGLLYLMFMAGLELDLRSSLGENRRDTVLFGAATFTVPLVVGIVALLLWGFDPLAAVLIASCWSSHTLVSYPIFQRAGVVQARAAATAIGATLITNVAALLVLAVVIALHSGDGGAASWILLTGGLLLLCVASFWGLRRMTRWFFAGLGGDRLAQTVYVLVMMFAAAALASAVGIEPIVGAFFAGLGMNEHVPKNGSLGHQLQFLGDSLLVPVFLISVGMIIDPANLLAGTTVVTLAATFAFQSLGGKLLAALGAGRYLRYGPDDIGAMFSLTAAEAAATLAAIFVGFRAGLFGQEVVDAVVIVILVTCLVSTLCADRYAPRLRAPGPRAGALGRNVLVPVADPASAGLLTRLAANIASSDTGTVRPVSVLPLHAERSDVLDHRRALVSAEAYALRAGVEAQGAVRVDESPLSGIAHEVLEHDVTCVVLGWKGQASRREHLFGGITDSVARRLPVPVVLVRAGSTDDVGRVVIHIRRDEAADTMSLEIASRLARSNGVPLVITGPDDAIRSVTLPDRTSRYELIPSDRPAAAALASITGPGDVVVVDAPGGRAARWDRRHQLARMDLRQVARSLPDRTLIACVGG